LKEQAMVENCCKPAKSRKKRVELPAEELAAICKALAHPARVRLLSILLEKGECISGDLAEEFPLAQSTVSEHLRILKDAGLVQGTIDGPRRSYCINSEVLERFKSLVESI